MFVFAVFGQIYQIQKSSTTQIFHAVIDQMHTNTNAQKNEEKRVVVFKYKYVFYPRSASDIPVFCLSNRE